VKLPVKEPAPSDQIPESPLEPGDKLLVWTTTPWTLITNAAVAAGPEIEYVRARLADEVFVMARERVERGPPASTGRDGVDRLEEARQRLEGPVVLLLLDEEPQHRLGADERDRETIRILARRPVGVDERDAGHGVQLPGSLMEHELDVRERLEAGAETRLRLPHALCDRPDPAVIGRVHMKNAVGLAEAERAEDHRLRLDRAPHRPKPV
jgi:hypothetical protein